ncbi:MAG: ATP-binding protein [Spirochaetes bacterium]|nr:ATP-binding protein [Spirochaetota bacterium]
MVITIASGKGGTGKTTVALSVATLFSTQHRSVALLDCDVEEPNDNLFLGAPIESTEEVCVPVPLVDENRCDGCGECEKLCEFSAIVLVRGLPLLFPEMCHSCGGCALVCPPKAITERDRRIGVIESGRAGGIRYAGGRLDIGEVMSPPLIKNVKKKYPDSEIRILDSPPGTSCPVIETVRDSDFLVLVTEPTPFGLNDLSLAVDMARAVGVPFGVVINRSDGNDHLIADYCTAEGIAIITAIPDTRSVAEHYSRGDFIEHLIGLYGDRIQAILDHAGVHGREGAKK